MYRVYAQRLPVEQDGYIAVEGHSLRAYKANLVPVGTARNIQSARQYTVAPVLEPLPELRGGPSDPGAQRPPATVHRLPAGRNRFLRRRLGMDKTLQPGIVGNAL